jgi:DNA polymerase III subunit delta'
MNNWDLITGHEWAVNALRAALEHSRTGHAYLFVGPAQVGKTTLALTFAQALNCTEHQPERRPCGRCRACTLIQGRRHPDVIIVTGERSGRGKATIKIDQIRELQHQLSLTATEARYKVALLRGFEGANVNSANAFLKTLEEPPPNVVLLLTATEADMLLPTVLSRCRIIALRPLAAPVIAKALQERWSVGQDEARLLSRLADGRLGWALQAAREPEVLEGRRVHLDRLVAALTLPRVGRFELAEELSADPETLPEVLRVWLTWWRDVMLLAAADGQSEAVTNIDRREELDALASRWHGRRAVESLRQTEQALWQLAHNANTRLVMENLLLAYPLPV